MMNEEINTLQETAIQLKGRTDYSRGDVADDVDIDAVLEGWSPGRNALEDRLRVTAAREALKWLRDYGGFATAADFKRELHDDLKISGQIEHTWWAQTIRPALQRAVGADLVEYRVGNHEYRWIQEE